MNLFRNILVSLLFLTSFAKANTRNFVFEKTEKACRGGGCCYADLEYGKGSILFEIKLIEEKLDIELNIACRTRGTGYGKTLKETYVVQGGAILSSEGKVIGQANERQVHLSLYNPGHPDGRHELIAVTKTLTGAFHFVYTYGNGNPASDKRFWSTFEPKQD